MDVCIYWKKILYIIQWRHGKDFKFMLETHCVQKSKAVGGGIVQSRMKGWRRHYYLNLSEVLNLRLNAQDSAFEGRDMLGINVISPS